MNIVIENVYKYIEDNKMLQHHHSVIVGVSGGADSVCLYKMLLELKDRLDLKLYVVHVHHGIRGSEADRDAEFVRKMCEEDKVNFKLYKYNVPEYAEKNGLSEEEAGRILRYETFGNEADKIGDDAVIAVAHNRNDVAETFVHNLCRGSGLKGLTGIECINGRIIRPIICLERSEIEEYLRLNGYKYINDSTNMSMDYTRNKIRNIVLPYLNENINSNSVSHILNVTDELRAAEGYLCKKTDEAYENMVRRNNNCICIDKKCYYEAEDYIKSRVVRKAICEAAGKLKDITRVHISDIMDLFYKQTGKYIMLPYGIKVYSEYDSIVFAREDNEKLYKVDNENEKKIAIDVTKTGTYYCGNYCFEVEIIEVNKDEENIKIMENIVKNGEKLYTKWFDYDKINFAVHLRNILPEDYIVINQAGNRKKIKNYLVDEKVPQNERDNVMLLADGSNIIWVVGHRISEAYKVTTDTKRILKITRKDKMDGGQN